ncbi:ABC transporter substrate-binding protein [Jiangella endophytica]|uniref:ABC transporter substrate-binding protein n=1 Tax=Jiangella endophytica TaxID=1623398 RepID=UPI000E356176|nr:sugar ABC transporter substrate-binding protein [Jiangella endophytica]
MGQPTTRTLSVAAAIGAGLLVLAGCGGSATNSSGGGDEEITLTFANADPAETWAAVIEGFEEQHPGITVKQLNIPYAQYTSTINQRMGSGGEGIDLMVVDAGGAALDWNNRGYLADITDLREDAIAAAVSESMVTAREVDGKLLALAPWTTSQFLYYNVDVLAAAGVEAPPSDPATPWTYEQLTEAARAVQSAGAAEYPLLFDQWDTYYQLQMMGVSAGGGDGIDADGVVDFSDDGWQHALSWYHGLFEDGLSPRGITNDKNGALFQEGKAAFIISGPWGVSVANAGGIDYGVAPAPYFEGGEAATSTDSWAVGVSSKTENLDAAKEFLRYLTIDPDGNAQAAEVAGITPTNKEAFAAYVEQVNASAGAATAGFGAILQYQLENNAVHRPTVVGYSVFEPGAGQLFSDIRNGSDPAERAAQADEEITAQIERLR